MRIDIIFPHFEFDANPLVIRDYAQTVEGLSYTHIKGESLQ